MKKIISTIASSMIVFLVSGQQKLSYTYDAAGNRTNRTIIVAARSTSEGLEECTTQLYADSFDGKELPIDTDTNGCKPSISIDELYPSWRAGYSILYSEGKLRYKNMISRETSQIALGVLPTIFSILFKDTSFGLNTRQIID